MEKHHGITYVLVLLLLVFQLTSFVFITIQFSKLNTKIDFEIKETQKNTTKLFTDTLENYDAVNQRNINELSLAVAQQASKQESFEDQINLVKTTQGDFTSVIESAVKGVVAVLTENSMGSGFIVNPNGYIVTNYHVLQRSDTVRVLTHDKRILPATILGVDILRDLALLKVQGEFKDLELADSDDLQLGRKVIAIGNPLGLSFTVTEGIISGLDREGPNGIEEYVQTDVPLNPGNSGGPLLDIQGRVVGINNFKIAGTESLGFALESNSIKTSINDIAGQKIIS
jgi:S1-C subfamily serine protease